MPRLYFVWLQYHTPPQLECGCVMVFGFFPDLFSLLLNYISKKNLIYKNEQNISYKDWEEGMHISIITHRIKSFKQNVLNTCSLVMLFYLCNISVNLPLPFLALWLYFFLLSTVVKTYTDLLISMNRCVDNILIV